jgi:hypothetical protein
MPEAHDESLTSDMVSRPFLGYSTHDESLTEDRVIGPARLSFTGALDITVVRGAEQPIHVEVPATPYQQATAAGWLVSGMVAGGWIGGMVHLPLVGAVAGVVGAKRLWNRWARDWQAAQRSGQ